MPHYFSAFLKTTKYLPNRVSRLYWSTGRFPRLRSYYLWNTEDITNTTKTTLAIVFWGQFNKNMSSEYLQSFRAERVSIIRQTEFPVNIVRQIFFFRSRDISQRISRAKVGDSTEITWHASPCVTVEKERLNKVGPRVRVGWGHGRRFCDGEICGACLPFLRSG